MREQILYNKFKLPGYDKFLHNIGRHYTEIADRMMKAAWSSYLHKGADNNINLTHWADQFDNDEVFNVVLISLSNAGWLVTIAAENRNWAEASLNENKLLNYCTIEELLQVRRHYKFIQYALAYEDTATRSTLTRVNGKIKETGLSAPGTMNSSNQPFSFDREMMAEYQDIILRNMVKSMDKIAEQWPSMRHDEASYDAISAEILDYYINNDAKYTRGQSYMDSRGRAISGCLSKIGNPIGYKDFRALLVLPTEGE